MSKNDDQLRSEIESNEAYGEWGAWSVVAGLVLEIVLAAVNSLGYGNKNVENWGGVVADCLVALGVYAEIHFGRRASHAGLELRRRSDERVAEANASAAKANLETENLRRQVGPRHIERKMFLETLALCRDPPSNVEILYAADNMDAHTLMLQLRGALQEAKWPIFSVRSSLTEEILKRSIGFPMSIVVNTKTGTDSSDFLAWSAISFGKTPEGEPTTIAVLIGALMRVGVHVSSSQADPTLPEGQIRVIIGPR